MLRRSLLTLAAPVVMLAVAGCGDGPDPAPSSPTPGSTAAPVQGLPVLGPAVQELEFLGVTSGSMVDADASCAWLRGSTSGSDRFQISLSGMVGGSRHRLRIIVYGYEGPGVYEWDGTPGSGPEVVVEFDDQRGHALVVVQEPGDTGEIEAALTNPWQGRITGFWQCPAVPR